MSEFEKYLKEHSDYPDFTTEEIKLMQQIWDHRQKKIDAIAKIVHDAYMSDGNSSIEIIYDKIKELLK